MSIKRLRNRAGTQQAKAKVAANNAGGFGTDPKNLTVTKGACLTFTEDDTVGLAGANENICGFADEIEGENIRYFMDYEIEGILTTGKLTVGRGIVGSSDSDRGKAKDAPEGSGRWLVKSSVSGKATVVP